VLDLEIQIVIHFVLASNKHTFPDILYVLSHRQILLYMSSSKQYDGLTWHLA